MPETSAQQTCPHGLRPGTTVCLHCRQDARNAARQRRYQLLARTVLVLLGGGLIIALIIGGIQALRPNGRTEPSQDDVAAAVTVSEPSASPTSSAPAETALLPVIPEGRHELSEGMYALREGRQVTVYFDTDQLRTRYDWKFEGVVRATLPTIYGQEVRTALDSIAVGTWVGAGDLLTELPQQGIPLELPKGSIRVFPITRAGRDGPLVVAYRAIGAR